MSGYTQNTLILTKKPFVGCMPGDVRRYLCGHPDDRALANAMAEVWNKTGMLGHLLDETDDHWVDYAFGEWEALEHELFAAITKRMEKASQRGENYDLSKKGIALIEQFMLRNGYYNGSGWWCEREEPRQEMNPQGYFGVNAMDLEWIDYQTEDAPMIDGWLDVDARAMTGIDQGWDAYWQAVLADAVHFPGCKDFCQIVWKGGEAVAVVVYGCFEGVGTVSELVVAPDRRGMGLGTEIIRALAIGSDNLMGEQVREFRAVIFPENIPSQRAFQKAGFVFHHTHADAAAMTFVYTMR